MFLFFVVLIRDVFSLLVLKVDEIKGKMIKINLKNKELNDKWRYKYI